MRNQNSYQKIKIFLFSTKEPLSKKLHFYSALYDSRCLKILGSCKITFYMSVSEEVQIILYLSSPDSLTSTL